MAIVNLTMLALKADNLMKTADKSEADAVAQVIEEAGFTEEQLSEMDLASEITKFMNRDTEAEKAEAEAQLEQQASGYVADVMKEEAPEAPEAPAGTPDPAAE